MPHVADHAILGRAIVPGVELLNLLQRTLDESDVLPNTPPTMRDVSFPRFLSVEETSRCTFEIALEETADGDVRSTFSSRITLPGGMQRERVHAQVTFAHTVPCYPTPPAEGNADFDVPAERVYRELIPFGPRFCNLRGTLRLSSTGAWATVESPFPPHPSPSRAGCPYLLDSAMHLACVWGQRYAGVVPYPTGFSSRTVFLPISQGKRRCTAVARTVDPRRLIFDLWLRDDDGQVCDVIGGLVMAPLAAGTLPPAWIVEAKA
jgi:hypothetical protein